MQIKEREVIEVITYEQIRQEAQGTKNQTKAKKDYLNSYLQMKRDALSKQELIDYIRGKEMGHAITYSAVPGGGSSPRDLSDFAARLDEACAEMEEANRQAVERMTEIIHAINEMEDAEEKELLRKRYIIGEAWKQIAVEMHLSWRTTFRRHGDALEHFVIPRMA